MKRTLTAKENLLIATMLFGLFFGAGNLIFPAYMGQMAGQNVGGAIAGFVITGVGLPLLGVAAIGISKSSGLFELGCKVGRRYSMFFTCALYLTIGPFFAIPRCATVPFTVAVANHLPEQYETLALAAFSLVFFVLVYLFSRKPGKILTYVGKVLTPVFLLFLAFLVLTVLLRPTVSIGELPPLGAYREQAFFTGFLEGYNTMDALASLAFGIIVVDAVRSLGVEQPQHIAKCTATAGIFSCLIMAVIYLAVTLAGTQSRSAGVEFSNGGEVLAMLANSYFGSFGALILTATVTLACLKTSVGLVTSCAETFCGLFPKGPGYRTWAALFSLVSFLIANIGLNRITSYSLPVLMLLYPLAITLILMGLCGHWFRHDPAIYRCVTGFTLLAALLDLGKALPTPAQAFLHLENVIALAEKFLPFYTLGIGWLCPAALGLAVGLLYRQFHRA